MSLRRPVRAVQSSPIPSLALWLAGVVTGCHEPQCATERAGELDQHGAQAAERLRRHDLPGAARELGLATGVLAHPASPAVQVLPPYEVPPAGGAMEVTPAPPVPPPETQVTGGAVPVVLPTPPPPTTPTRRGGAVRRVTPQPQRTPPPPARPVRESTFLGDTIAVGPTPPEPRQR